MKAVWIDDWTEDFWDVEVLSHIGTSYRVLKGEKILVVEREDLIMF